MIMKIAERILESIVDENRSWPKGSLYHKWVQASDIGESQEFLDWRYNATTVLFPWKKDINQVIIRFQEFLDAHYKDPTSVSFSKGFKVFTFGALLLQDILPFIYLKSLAIKRDHTDFEAEHDRLSHASMAPLADKEELAIKNATYDYGQRVIVHLGGIKQKHQKMLDILNKFGSSGRFDTKSIDVDFFSTADALAADLLYLYSSKGREWRSVNL